MEGFLVTRWLDRWEEGIKQMAAWVMQGKIQTEETIMEGFEKMPDALIGLFTGSNKGKMVVKAWIKWKNCTRLLSILELTADKKVFMLPFFKAVMSKTIRLDHIILTDDMIWAALGLSDPPILHIIIDLGRLVRVQSFAYVAKALMVSKSACIKVAPPKILIEFGIVRIQKLEVMSQGFGAAKKEERLYCQACQR